MVSARRNLPDKLEPAALLPIIESGFEILFKLRMREDLGHLLTNCSSRIKERATVSK
ncbi:hypothetical protein LEP1GSC193_0577 [Leptospira alstonii serovar Pingchang str. 80-412]|uniref:Uncharacterized protein n=1 Tax=Leptospira alstonii serovar Pingchang str. 80-412 TaxID=1218564 RepID=T0G019_9LEPT|nr:hypothetical protein LEP1GSC193_0577 [Leptospira alstonii serovar Pingchang str. 80-412]